MMPPHQLIQPTGQWVDPHVTCPVCGFGYTHLREVSMRAPQSATLLFDCEECHRFAVEFTQHEGATFVEVREEPA